MKIKVLILLFACVMVTIVSSTTMQKLLQPFMNGPTKELFKAYHLIFKKEYELNSEDGVVRYRAFKQNLKTIEEINSKNLGYTLGITEFTDLTKEEFLQKYQKSSMKGKALSFIESRSASSYTPGAMLVDWTFSTNPAKTQGKCVSSYATAASSAVESAYYLASGKVVNVSVQQMVDCNYDNINCFGGFPDRALKYLINGVALENDYPFVSGVSGVQNVCTYNSLKWLNLVTGYTTCDDGTIDCFLSMLKKGPVIVPIDPTPLQNYVSGIIDPLSCNTDLASANFVVALGIKSDGNSDYVILQNSWGANWGENGYFRLRVNQATNTCGIFTSNYQPQVNASPMPILSPTIFQYNNWNKAGSGGVSQLMQPNGDITSTPFYKNFGSMQVRSSVVSIFPSKNCVGAPYRITADNPDIKMSTNVALKNAASNAKSWTYVLNSSLPAPRCIALFSNSCFTGNMVQICQNTPDLSAVNFSAQTVGILFGSNVTKVTVYTQAGYTGNRSVLTASNANLSSSTFFKPIISLSIGG